MLLPEPPQVAAPACLTLAPAPPTLPYAEVGLCQGDLPGKPGGAYAVVIAYGP